MNHNKDRNHRPRFLPNIAVDNLKVSLEDALNVDLKEVVVPGVYPDKLNGDFSKTYLVQIKKIVEIGPNKVLNGGHHQRSLLLHLSDGHASHKALEVGEIPGLSLNTRPGTKVILFGPKLKIVGNSFMYLDSNMAQVIGGGISELNAKWEMTKSVENRRRDNTAREGGAPAWAPFGKKINKDSLKIAKNPAPPKEEKKNPAFEAQRKDAISTASRNPQQPRKPKSEENAVKSENSGRNNRNQSQRQTYNKAETQSAEPTEKVTPPEPKSASSKPAEKVLKETTNQPPKKNQPQKDAFKSSAPKEPIKIAQKKPPVQVNNDPAPDASQNPPPVTLPSYHEQFQQPPPSYNNYSQENARWKNKSYSNGSFTKNQPDITTSHTTETDIGSFSIPTQSYTASSYSSNLPNQSFSQNEYYIQNPIHPAIAPTTRHDYDYKTMTLPGQSLVQYPSSAYTSAHPTVSQLQNYGNTNYYDAALQPPLTACNKNDYAESCLPSQTLVFTSSAYSDGQAQNPIQGYVPNTFEASKLPYSRTQFSEPPPTSYDSQNYRSNYLDGSSQSWIPSADTSNKVQSYPYLKTNYDTMQSQSSPVQLDYDNQTQVYNRSNFSNGNNVPLKLQNEYVTQYSMNSAISNDSALKQAQRFDQNNYNPQPYVYKSRGGYSGGGYPGQKTDESFASRGFQRQYVRAPFKPNERPRAPSMRGGRGRGFSYPNQPRFPGPSAQPGVLYEYLDNKLPNNTG